MVPLEDGLVSTHAHSFQLAAAVENLKHIFNVPESVKRTEDLINDGKLLHAHRQYVTSVSAFTFLGDNSLVRKASRRAHGDCASETQGASRVTSLFALMDAASVHLGL